jgi:hypothetical protein
MRHAAAPPTRPSALLRRDGPAGPWLPRACTAAAALALAGATAGRAEGAPADEPEALRWPALRWDGPPGAPVSVERGPEVDLGPHSGLTRADLSPCWRQHAAHRGEDLQLTVCADVQVDDRGRVRARAEVQGEDPSGLARCVEALLQRWEGPSGAPAEGRLCRAVRTSLSAEARAAWAIDPSAEVWSPSATPPPCCGVEVGRPERESARRWALVHLWSDALGDPIGVPQLVPAPVGPKDRLVASAARHLTDSLPALRQCAAGHLRSPTPVTVDLRVVVSPSGVARVLPGASRPVGHEDLAACAAALTDPGLAPGVGDGEIVVPVRFLPE